MRNFISSGESSMGGCLGVGCLSIFLGGYIVSALLNVEAPREEEGSRPVPPAALVQPRLAEDDSTSSEVLVQVPVREPSPPPAASQPPPEPAAPRPEGVCGTILGQLGLVDRCDLLDVGGAGGLTLFLTVPSQLLNEELAADFVPRVYDILGSAGTRPDTLALEGPDASLMLGMTDLQTCMGETPNRVPLCIRKTFVKIRRR